MRLAITLCLTCCFALSAPFAAGALERAETGAASLRSSASPIAMGQEADKLVYADFESLKDNRPTSNRGGSVFLFSYQERPTLPSRYRGADTSNAPEVVRTRKDSPNRAITFDYILQGQNQYAGVGVRIHGQADKDGKPVADDVSEYKYLMLELYVTGVSSITVEFISQGQGIEMSSGYPQMTFKVNPGQLNTYRIPLKSLAQPSWAEVKVNPKDVLKKLTSVSLAVTCNKCTGARGTVVVDNLVFQN